MSKDLVIKGYTIGQGKPLVCVPVMAKDKAGVVAGVRQYVEAGVPMVEWRVDTFEQDKNLEEIKAVLEEIKPLLEKTILVFTYRTKGQGGTGTADKHEQYFIHELAVKSGVVDFVDVEYFELKKPNKGIKQLQDLGAHIIASHHDFNETPDANIISMILDDMYESAADVVKLAVMPNCIEDVYTIMFETTKFKKEHPDKPIITMSMGPIGSITRFTGQYYGSCVTFGAGEEASAPGQLPYKELGQMLEIIDKSINK